MKGLSHSEYEADDNLPTSGFVALSIGLLLAVGMVLFSGIGAILGEHMFSNAFGWNQDVVVGAFAGGVIGILLAIEAVKVLTGRLSRTEM